MDAYEFVKLQAERSPKDMETTYFMNYDGKKWGLEDYRNIPQYNWQDEIFRSAWMQSHNVSLTKAMLCRYSSSFSRKGGGRGFYFFKSNRYVSFMVIVPCAARAK